MESIVDFRFAKIISEIKKLKIFKGEDQVFRQKFSYKNSKPYGKGGFGTVLRGEEIQTKRQVAIKMIPNQLDDLEIEQNVDLCILEFQNLDKLLGEVNPSIVCCEGIYIVEQKIDDEIQIKIMMIFPAAENSLYDLYKDNKTIISEEEVYIMVKQVLEGLRYLIHKHNMQHRDIKMGNILVIKKGQCALADFGISKVKDGQLTQSHISNQSSVQAMGSNDYWPYEVIIQYNGDKRFKIDGQKSDIFALGIVALNMVNKNITPRSLTNLIDGQQNILIQIGKLKNQNLINLLKGMLQRDMITRFSSFQALHLISTQEENQILKQSLDQPKKNVIREIPNLKQASDIQHIQEQSHDLIIKRMEKDKGKGLNYKGNQFEISPISQKVLNQEIKVVKGNQDDIKQFAEIKEVKGQYKYPDGTLYQGNYLEIQKEGKGKCIYPDGSYYIGDYKNDKMEGKGLYVYISGASYEGDWKQDKKEGKGKYIYPSRASYEGDFKNSLREGKGKYIYPDGDSFEGVWKNDIQQTQNYYQPQPQNHQRSRVTYIPNNLVINQGPENLTYVFNNNPNINQEFPDKGFQEIILGNNKLNSFGNNLKEYTIDKQQNERHKENNLKKNIVNYHPIEDSQEWEWKWKCQNSAKIQNKNQIHSPLQTIVPEFNSNNTEMGKFKSRNINQDSPGKGFWDFIFGIK